MEDDSELMDLDNLPDSDADFDKGSEAISDIRPAAPKNSDKLKTAKSKSLNEAEISSLFTKADWDAIQRNKEFNAMSDAEKVIELQRRLKEAMVRACTAETELRNLQTYHDNLNYHKDGIIKNLEARLADAETQVAELEALYCAGVK